MGCSCPPAHVAYLCCSDCSGFVTDSVFVFYFCFCCHGYVRGVSSGKAGILHRTQALSVAGLKCSGYSAYKIQENPILGWPPILKFCNLAYAPSSNVCDFHIFWDFLEALKHKLWKTCFKGTVLCPFSQDVK